MKNNLSILVVEDNSGDARLIKELLSEGGHLTCDFIFTKTLAEALSICKENNKIDLIFLDLGLPDSQGVDTFLKMQRSVIDIPIIVLAGVFEGDVAITCLKEGAQDYINKEYYDGPSLFRSITSAIERKQAEKSLHEYASFLKSSNDAILSSDLNGIVTLWNRGAERLFGYKTNKIIGQNASILLPPEKRDDMMNLIHIIKEDKEIFEYEMCMVTKEGRRLSVLINAAPIKNRLDQITGLAVIAHDITYIKQNEIIMAIEYRVALALSESTDLISAGHNVLKIICEIQNWQVGAIWAIDQAQNILRYVNMWHNVKISAGIKENNKELVFPRGEDLPGYLWEANRPLFIEDLNQFALKSHYLDIPKDLSCCFGFPIAFRGEILGIILLFGHKGLHINRNFINMFGHIGEQIGGFIKRKRLEGNLLYLSEHDILTGLVNRKYFSSSLINEVIRCKTHKLNFGILSQSPGKFFQ